MVQPEHFEIPLDGWDNNTLIQGLNYFRKMRIFLIHRAKNVSGQAFQDVVIHQKKVTDGTDLGTIVVKGGGHGSSLGMESIDGNTVACWFGSDAARSSGYVKFDIGESGTKTFTKMDLPEGDIEIDQRNNRLILRNGNRYRLYDFASVKENQRKKLADFTIASWGLRWQGMYLTEGKLAVHRDFKTKGKSQADIFDLTGSLPKSGQLIKPEKTIDTTRMGDEAEGFHSLDDGDNVVLWAMKRTGPANDTRILEGTRVAIFPKLVKEVPPTPKPPTPPPTPVVKTIHGVDVSSWQKGWRPDSDDSFVFVKSSEGSTYLNPDRTSQLASARAAGLQVGHYHFMWPNNPESQAEFFVKNSDIQEGDLLVCDWEETNGGHPSVEDAAKFQAEVKRLVGGRNLVGLYCNESDWLNTKVKALDFLWGAKYAKSHNIKSDQLKFWQYTREPLDQNVGYFKSLEELKVWSTVVVKEEPEPESPDTLPEIPPVIIDPTPIENVGVWVVNPEEVKTFLWGRDLDGNLVDQVSPGTTIGDGVAWIKNSVGQYALLTTRGFSYDKRFLLQIGAAPVVRPFPVIPDYDQEERIKFRGGLVCRCVAISLPWVEYAMLQAGLIKFNLDFYQFGYRTDVAASANTHARGGNTDGAQCKDSQLAIFRMLGWTSQRRTVAQGFSGEHWHGWPVGCPHLAPSAQTQAKAWSNGRDGLRQNRSITGPEPKGPATKRWDVALSAYMKKVANN